MHPGAEFDPYTLMVERTILILAMITIAVCVLIGWIGYQSKPQRPAPEVIHKATHHADLYAYRI